MVIEVRQTDIFKIWLEDLRDLRARMRILARIERMIHGNLGDIKSLGHGISELRIDYGPGYRVYILRRGKELIILLAGGDKSTQTRDIQRAILLARTLSE